MGRAKTPFPPPFRRDPPSRAPAFEEAIDRLAARSSVIDARSSLTEPPLTRQIPAVHTPAHGFGAATIALALIAAPSLAAAQTPSPAAPPAATPPPATATPPAATPPATATTPKTGAPATPPGKAPAGAQKGALKPLEPPPLPDTPARLWLIAPGPHEAWTMRIDNDGTRPIRVPADVRLLRFEIEVASADPKKKKPDVYKCEAPASIRPSGFPERRALLLSPGQSYIESFDPRLFCFGKSAAGLVGTALVKTTFGWEPEKKPKWGPKKTKPPVGPFAVESTDNPSATAPLKQLVAPSLVLSFGTQGAASEPPSTIAGVDVNPPGAPVPGTYRPAPPVKEAPPPPPPPPVNTLAPGRSGGRSRDVAISRKLLDQQNKDVLASVAASKASPGAIDTSATTAPAETSATTANTASATPATPANSTAPATTATPDGAPANGTATPAATPAPPKPVDQNAPRLVVETSAFSDASAPASASISVTVKNGGGRAMTAAIKPRMISFEVTGPDHTVTCPSWPPTHAIPRESYREYKPNATTSFTLLLDEVCPDVAFSRPGLYSVRAGVWANESGDEIGVAGFVGRAKAAEPTLLRLQSGKESFYREAPRAVPTPTPKIEDDALDAGSAAPAKDKPAEPTTPGDAAPPASTPAKAPGG